ncbi:STAS/SEC14 domain-containing protein [Mycolicibacterium agri]|uniref:STAS/SEC14 domain-containing protein n=1 Tax=Mycolicibacterium agri TaxID=36811 RepID=UPI001F2CA9DF|nr:STAS/SEC14 domain-containing protein [Mycolicibacterium agri]
MRFTGTLDRGSYRDVLKPRIESLLQRHATLRVLVLMDESFKGWTLSGGWANTLFDLKHRRDFDKVAMVGAPKWESLCVKALAALLMKGELRTFRRDQLGDAWNWLRA